MSVPDHILERHSRMAVLIDRLRTIWTPCTFESLNGEYHPIDDEEQKDIIAELEWLQRLLGTAMTNGGDVSSIVNPPAPAQRSAPPDPPPSPTGPRPVMKTH
jgi:hypothetical protein